MTIEVALVISIISVSFSVYFGLKNSKKSDRQEIGERVAWNTKVEMKLDSIGSSVNEIKNEITSIGNKVDTLTERMAKVEASSKQAHKRIDDIETKGRKGGIYSNDDE